MSERMTRTDHGSARDRVEARTYGRHGGAETHPAQVAELHWPDGRVVQISGADENDERGLHVLIRVWPKNGGGNLTSFSALLRPDGDDWLIQSLDTRRRGQ